MLAHTRADAAAAVVAVVTDAEDKIDGIAGENNVSTTALGQAILAGTLTEGQLIAAMAELEAWDASTRAAEPTTMPRSPGASSRPRSRRYGRRWPRSGPPIGRRSGPAATERLEALYGGFRLHPFFGGASE